MFVLKSTCIHVYNPRVKNVHTWQAFNSHLITYYMYMYLYMYVSWKYFMCLIFIVFGLYMYEKFLTAKIPWITV